MANLAMFDIDGTLVDSNKVDAECFARSIKEEFGIDDIDERWETYKIATDFGIFEEIFERAFRRMPSEPEVRRHIERFANLLKEYYLEDPALFREIDGAGEILEKLENHPEWKVGIATGAWKESALFKLQSAGLEVEDIPLVTCSDAKTREEILRKCITDSKERCGVAEFEKTVSVGDALWDVKTANRLKVGFIGINEPGKFDGFPNCKVLRDFSKGETFMRYLEEAEVPELP